MSHSKQVSSLLIFLFWIGSVVRPTEGCSMDPEL